VSDFEGETRRFLEARVAGSGEAAKKAQSGGRSNLLALKKGGGKVSSIRRFREREKKGETKHLEKEKRAITGRRSSKQKK